MPIPQDITDPESLNSTESLLAELPIAEKKITKGIKYRTWNSNAIPAPIQKYKKPSEKEIMEVQ